MHYASIKDTSVALMDTYLSGPSTSFTLPTIFSGAAFLGFGGVYNFTCIGNPTTQYTYIFYDKPFIILEENKENLIYDMQLCHWQKAFHTLTITYW